MPWVNKSSATGWMPAQGTEYSGPEFNKIGTIGVGTKTRLGNFPFLLGL